jgi:hypothetical protein
MIFKTFIFLLLSAVVVVLILGALNMGRRGSAERAQKLMRWRVGLQLAAIITLALFFFSGGYPSIGYG